MYTESEYSSDKQPVKNENKTRIFTILLYQSSIYMIMDNVTSFPHHGAVVSIMATKKPKEISLFSDFTENLQLQ